MTMRSRRFMFLAVALVALNAAFWLAGGALGLPQAIVNQFFGGRMIRAEVILQSPAGPQDWRIDRGVITTVTAGPTITIRESDGTIQTVAVDPAAHVTGPTRFAAPSLLRPRLRVVVYHQANAQAELVQVEGVAR
jgi:hypothetical protein